MPAGRPAAHALAADPAAADRARERQLRAAARRHQQTERLQDDWDALEDRAMLAQRLALGGDAMLAAVAAELGLQPQGVRKWHTAWRAALLGPRAPADRW